MKIVLIFLLTCKLIWGVVLEKEYTFSDEVIYSDELVSGIENIFAVVEIPQKRMLYRVKAQTIIDAFAKEGMSVTASSPIITFKRTLFLDYTPIETAIEDFYHSYFPDLSITALHVSPRSYLKSLPESYEVVIPKPNHTRHKGVLYLLSSEGKRIFFNFELTGMLPVLVSKSTINRKESLNFSNTVVETHGFEGFKTAPLSHLENGKWRAKMRIVEGKSIMSSSVEPIPLVKRHQNVVVTIKDGALTMQISAVAQEDGALYDMITVTKSDGEVLKARVVGTNRLEIE